MPPLYELEEGESRKFYRIERVGCRVDLAWGRIGTAGSKKSIEHATEAAAIAEYDDQILKRRERGYRLVLDESLPHDPADAKRPRIAPSKNPRFLFVHKRNKRFVWLEADGATLLRAEGTLGNETSVTPLTEACASPAAATRKRDLATAKLLGEGFALADFAAAAAPAPAKKRTRPTLKENPELESIVRRDITDESGWSVLEDWLLEHEDPRAEIVRHERARERADAAQARGRLATLLLGKVTGIEADDWRAGYARVARLSLTRRTGRRALDAFVDAPAFALVRRLEITFDDPSARPELSLQSLARAPAIHGARELLLAFIENLSDQTTFDAEVLEPFRALTSLTLGGIALSLRYAPALERLTTLHCMPPLADELADLFSPGRFAALRRITLDLSALEHGRFGSSIWPELEPGLRGLLDGTCAPRVTAIDCFHASPATAADAARAIERSGISARHEAGP